jgi:FRG domain
MKVIEEIEFCDAREFFLYLSLHNDTWWDKDGKQSWIFRGISNSRFNLVPSDLRSIISSNNINNNANRERLFRRIEMHLENHPQKEKFINTSEENRRRLWWIFIQSGVHQFLNNVREAGFSIDIEGHFSLSIEQIIYISLIDFGRAPQNKSEISCWALAQHHGIPTYLLDWTMKPHFSCFFACDNWHDSSASDIAVWAYSEENRNRVCRNYTASPEHKSKLELINDSFGDSLIRTSYYDNEYIKMQKGLFTWNKCKLIDPCLPTERWLGADEMIKDIDSDEPFLKKLILKANQVANLKNILHREGISIYSLMPTLDNIAIVTKSNW